MTKSNLGKKILSGTIWSVADNFLRQGGTFIIFIVLARILDPEVFGLLTIALLIINLFKAIVFDSIATAIIRKANPSLADYNTGFWLCIGLSMPAFVILFFSTGAIELWLEMEGLEKTLKGIGFVILTSGLCRMHEVWLTHKLDFKSLAIRSNVSVILGGGIGVLLATQGYGIEALVAQHIVTSCCELILLWIITPWKPSLQVSKESAKEIYHYAKHVALTGVTNFANMNSDAFFVSYYLGSAATGIYYTGKRISVTLNAVLSSALSRVSLPAFSRLQDDDEGLRKAYLSSTALTAMVTAPIFVGLSILSEDITILLLGDKWLDSVPIMQILTVIGFLSSIGFYNQSIMLAKNKPQWQTRLTLLYAISNIAVFVIFTRYGLVYTALAYSGRALLLYPVSVWCATTLTNTSGLKYFKALLPSILSAALMALVLYGLLKIMVDIPTILRLLLLILVGAMVYIFFIYFLMPKTYKDFIIKKYNDKFPKIKLEV